jgi:hypothetical protein
MDVVNKILGDKFWKDLQSKNKSLNNTWLCKCGRKVSFDLNECPFCGYKAGDIYKDKKSRNQKKWRVEFEGGHIVNLISEENNKDKIMMIARNMLSNENRYNFEARRASGGRILKVYQVR